MRDGTRIRRRSTDRSTPRVTDIDVASVVRDGTASGGQPLSAGAREAMEARLGHDFAAVRVHHDAAAGRSAETLGANAYAVGADVVFGEGKYAPSSDQGQALLAHELVHVVQQSRGGPRTAGGDLTLGARDTAAEGEAAAVSRTLASPARQMSVSGAESSVVQRDVQEIPETVITVTPEQHAAWKAGYDDARAGKPSDPFSRGLGPSQDYLDGYEAGAAEGPAPSEDAPPYDGPSIGPLSDEDFKRDQEAMRERQEREDAMREFLGELGNEDPEHDRGRGSESNRALRNIRRAPRPMPRMMPRR